MTDIDQWQNDYDKPSIDDEATSNCDDDDSSQESDSSDDENEENEVNAMQIS